MDCKETVVSTFKRNFGENFRLFAAPGRINLIGEHTDYNSGFVLPASIDKYIYLAIEPNGSNVVNLVSVDYNETFEINVENEYTKQDGFFEKINHLILNLIRGRKKSHWTLYPYGVIKEIQGLGHNIGGFNAVFGGNIPAGAGLSSSAALESVFGTAINTLFNLGIDKLKLAQIGQKAEHSYVGVKCGIMDQFASIFGQKDHVILLDCQSLEHSLFTIKLGIYELLLADTHVKHSLANSAYNERRNQCEQGVMTIATAKNGVKSLRDVSLDMLQQHREQMDKTVFTRCQYVIEENQRVKDTCEAIHANNLHKVGELMFESHRGLSTMFEVSCEELDLLVETAKNIEGTIGARMMGGGFGGCTINLVRKDAVGTFKQQLDLAFFDKYHHHPSFYDVKIENGAGEIAI